MARPGVASALSLPSLRRPQRHYPFPHLLSFSSPPSIPPFFSAIVSPPFLPPACSAVFSLVGAEREKERRGREERPLRQKRERLTFSSPSPPTSVLARRLLRERERNGEIVSRGVISLLSLLWLDVLKPFVITRL